MLSKAAVDQRPVLPGLCRAAAAAALVGAPTLVLLAARRMKAADHTRFALPKGPGHLARHACWFSAS
jgi:hypothetical protein